MKNLITVTILTLIPMFGFAKVSDFNAMISDNMNAQAKLHDSVQDNMGATRTAVREKAAVGKKVVLVEDTPDSYNSTTARGTLTFEKEKKHPAKHKTQFDRLATELNESEF